MRKHTATAILLTAIIFAPAATRAQLDIEGAGFTRVVPCETDCPNNRMLSVLGFAALAAAACWDIDENGEIAHKLETSPTEAIFDFGNTWGSGWVIGGGATAIFVAGSLGNDASARTLGADLMLSYALSGLTTIILKRAIDRRRPSGGKYSFPSGHTSSAFSIVPVLGHHLGWRATAPALTLGVITAMGRMQEHHHYLSDVFFGAAIGWAAGDLMIRTFRADLRSGSKTGPGSGNVMLAPGAVGYTASF